VHYKRIWCIDFGKNPDGHFFFLGGWSAAAEPTPPRSSACGGAAPEDSPHRFQEIGAGGELSAPRRNFPCIDAFVRGVQGTSRRGPRIVLASVSPASGERLCQPGPAMTDAEDRIYERVLVLRRRARDEAAFEEIVARYTPRLRYYLRRWLHTIPREASPVDRERFEHVRLSMLEKSTVVVAISIAVLAC
jgi:hypothetical protein